MDEQLRTVKRIQFGGLKYVYLEAMMNELKNFFNLEINKRFSHAKILNRTYYIYYYQIYLRILLRLFPGI